MITEQNFMSEVTRFYREFFNQVWKQDPDFEKAISSLKDTIYVKALADLPQPDGDGIITLDGETTYRIVGAVNLGINRLRVVGDAHLAGDNWGRDALFYSGTDYAVIAEGEKLNMKFMGIIAPNGGAIRFNSPEHKLTIFLCGFLAKNGCRVEAADVSSFKFCLFPFDGDVHLDFTGTIDKVLVDSSVFEAGSLGIQFTDLGVNTIDLSGNYFKMPEGAVGISSSSVTIANAGIVRGNSFEGNFTYTDGFDETTVGYDFKGNTNVPDSSVSGGFLGNTPVTVVITTQNEWVKISDTFTATTLERMTYSDGELTYTGLRPYRGRVIVSIAGEAPQNNQDYEIAIFKNGELTDKVTPIEFRFADVSQSTTLNDFLTLETDDEIDVRVRNTSSTQNFNLQTIATTFN